MSRRFATAVSLAAGLVLLGAETGPVPAKAWNAITPEGILQHIRILASDDFNGRAPATPAEQKTVDYLVRASRAMKLSPGKPKKGAKASKKAAKPERKATAPRAESKGAKILDMIARAKGATLAEIMKATDWQAHSVRGFISTAAKKHGVTIESAKNEAGERVYRSAK